ncbi:MAG: nucleotidyltransferase family protein [Clostridia bacterium]|nr:nucleotidyltransferase family protein [Clostridia bacterium]
MVACVLTAAGNSERFGRDKLLHPIDGRPMIEYALSLLEKVNLCHRVMVTQSCRQEASKLAAAHGFAVVYNDSPELGMSHSVLLGMEAVLNSCDPDGVLFCVADQPYLKQATVFKLLSAFEKEPGRIIRPRAGGRWGNPVIFPRETYPDLMRLEGDIGGSAVIRRRMELVKAFDISDERELFDIDTEQEEKDVRS